MSTILFPQFPLVPSKLLLCSFTAEDSSFLSAASAKGERLTLELAGVPLLEGNAAGGNDELPLAGFQGGDVETASIGDIDRIDADEGLRWKGGSRPDGIVSNFDFRFERAA